MLYIRWGLLTAAAAFMISIGLGIISGVAAFHIILRAFIFAFVFFGIGFTLRFLINNFFPELILEKSEAELQYSMEQSPSSESNIIDTMGEYAVPELYKTPGDPDELGNIEDLISGAFRPRSESVDRMKEEGYNVGGTRGTQEANIKSSRGQSQETINFQDMFPDVEDFDSPRIEAKAERAVFTPSFGDDAGLGGLPDLDAMAMAFGGSTPSSGGSMPYNNIIETAPVDYGSMEATQSYYVGNKPQTLKGDFNPKDLAEGIRTVLTKDK